MPRIGFLLFLLLLNSIGPAAAIGVETIRKHPQGSDVALVFVHGLGGGPCSSFESDIANANADDRIFECPRYEPGKRLLNGKPPLSWFTIFDQDRAASLPGDRTLGDIDLYTVSYMDAAPATISATEIGESLARNPEFLRILDEYNNVLFVAHSMGGIVLRRAIVRLQLNGEQARVDRIVGIGLLGSPSEGAPLADFVKDWGCWIPAVLRKVCWGEYVAQWYGAGWHQITDLQTLEGHNHLLAGLQTDWGSVIKTHQDKPFVVSCAYETVAEIPALKIAVVERIYTHTAGCFEQEPITQNHTALSKPVDIEDNRHQWLRGAIIEALQRVENFKLRYWSQSDALGALIDQIEIDAKRPRLPGTLGETVRVRPESAAEVNGLRLRPDNRNYGGPTWGALLKSIAASNSCFKVQSDRRRRQLEVWTDGAIACPTSNGASRSFACDLQLCR
jgi:pimeloyl-ACP methyl ester carboxylesterase